MITAAGLTVTKIGKGLQILLD